MSTTILVVDDDVSIQTTIGAILEDEGYRVMTAFDGVDALTKLGETSPDLILLDIGMPRMDGYTFADEMRRRGLSPGTPIVVVTADGRAPEKAARVGADGFLAKPFAMDTLLQQVEEVLAASGTKDEPMS